MPFQNKTYKWYDNIKKIKEKKHKNKEKRTTPFIQRQHAIHFQTHTHTHTCNAINEKILCLALKERHSKDIYLKNTWSKISAINFICFKEIAADLKQPFLV